MWFVLFCLFVPLLYILLFVLVRRYRRRIFVEDVKRAIIEAEYEIRKGNFELK